MKIHLRTFALLFFLFQPFIHAVLKGQVLAEKHVKEDLEVFIEALEHHPGLYLYRTEPQIDSLKKSLKRNLKDSMSYDAFYLSLLEALVFLKDGHTGLALGEKYSEFKRSPTTLPFEYKILEDRLYIVDTLASGLDKFMYSELISINEIPIDSILEKFFTYTTADNENQFYIKRYNERIFGQNFDFFFDGGNEYWIKAITNKGDSINTIVYGIKDFEKRKNSHSTIPISSVYDLERNLAILTVNTFIYRRIVDAGIDFHKVVDAFFKKVRQEGIENVAIDLRENYGGSSALAMSLYAYVTEEDFKWMDYSYTMLDGSETFAKYSQYQDGNYPFLSRHDTIREGSKLKVINGLDAKPLHSSTHIPYGPKMKIKKISKNKFTGHLYILTSGITFSAGSTFSSKCTERKNTSIIGESPGSASGVFCAGGYLNICLPNSGFIINLPTMERHLASSNQNLNPIAPLVPDYPVRTTIKDIKESKDLEMIKVYQLLEK